MCIRDRIYAICFAPKILYMYQRAASAVFFQPFAGIRSANLDPAGVRLCTQHIRRNLCIQLIQRIGTVRCLCKFKIVIVIQKRHAVFFTAL